MSNVFAALCNIHLKFDAQANSTNMTGESEDVFMKMKKGVIGQASLSVDSKCCTHLVQYTPCLYSRQQS